MSKYIKRFLTFSAAKADQNIYSPNVSYITDGDSERIMYADLGDNKNLEITGNTLAEATIQEKQTGPEYVDLGLSVKWAKCNIGATSETDYGKYFAWGETTGYTSPSATKLFSWADYQHVTNWINEKTGFNRYPALDEQVSQAFGMPVKVWADTNNTIVATLTETPEVGDLCGYSSDMSNVIFGKVSQVSGTVIAFKEPDTETLRSDIYDSNGILLPDYDAAHVAYGGDWRLPKKSEIEELINNTTYSWTTDYLGTGIAGRTFTANGNTLFIPASGFVVNGSFSEVGDGFYLWSSSLYSGGWASACYFYADSGYMGVDYGGVFCLGFALRAVC